MSELSDELKVLGSSNLEEKYKEMKAFREKLLEEYSKSERYVHINEYNHGEDFVMKDKIRVDTLRRCIDLLDEMVPGLKY